MNEELEKLKELEKQLSELRRKYSRGGGKHKIERELIRVVQQQITSLRSRLFETKDDMNELRFNIRELINLL